MIANTKNYRKGWGEYLLRVVGSRIPNIALEYNPKCTVQEMRVEGRPRNKWTLEFGIGHRPNP